MPSVYLKTYGCQMNERDSERVLRLLRDRGYDSAPSEKEADVILLNTCSVRDLAEQKALRKMANLRALRKKNPGVVLGFLGCMAQRRGRHCKRIWPGSIWSWERRSFTASPSWWRRLARRGCRISHVFGPT